MTGIKFFLEERGLAEQLRNPKNNLDWIERTVKAMEKICDSNVSFLFASENFYSIVVAGKPIAEWMFGTEQDGDIRELLARLGFALDRASSCGAQNNITGDGVASLCQNKIGGLISQVNFEHENWWVSEKMNTVSTPIDVTRTLRALYPQAKISINFFPDFCNEMFDNLFFFAPASDIKKTGLKYEEIITGVIAHFSYLNDFALINFDECTTDDEIIRRANACGVDISPEGPSKHKNKAAMKARDILIKGVVIRCEWHTKLTPTKGRIHFYARRSRPDEVSQITQEKVIVGIITNHLS